MNVLLDEHLSPRVAAGLRERGHDAVSVAERADLRGLSDERLWKAAIAEGRVLVTQDVRDFAVLVGRLTAAGGRHAGIVLVSSRSFPPSLGGIGRLVDALDGLAPSDGPGSPADRVVWLDSTDRPEQPDRGSA